MMVLETLKVTKFPFLWVSSGPWLMHIKKTYFLQVEEIISLWDWKTHPLIPKLVLTAIM